MSKIIVVVLALVILAGGGWYFYQGYETPDVAEENETTDFVLTASFMCADGKTRFEAAFPNADQVNILRDGVMIRTLPRTVEMPQTFEDSEYKYVFAGEEVTVTTKASNKAIVCSQPVDANNAPVNFGDAGEGGSIQPDVTLVVSESIVGKWKSSTDPFVREFKEGGSVVDMYDGEEKSEGTWKVFTKEKPVMVSFPLETGAVYIQLTMQGLQGEVLNFKLNKLTPDELELTYMDRGGVLRFTAVQ